MNIRQASLLVSRFTISYFGGLIQRTALQGDLRQGGRRIAGRLQAPVYRPSALAIPLWNPPGIGRVSRPLRRRGQPRGTR